MLLNLYYGRWRDGFLLFKYNKKSIFESIYFDERNWCFQSAKYGWTFSVVQHDSCFKKSGNDIFGILYLSNCIQKLIFFASAPFWHNLFLLFLARFYISKLNRLQSIILLFYKFGLAKIMNFFIILRIKNYSYMPLFSWKDKKNAVILMKSLKSNLFILFF